MSLWELFSSALAVFGSPYLMVRRSVAWTAFKNMNFKHFTEEEVRGLDVHLVDRLDAAREIAGVPFTITSGSRSAVDNERAMGVENSAHLKGLAVDLHIEDDPASYSRFLMVSALLQVGFKRLGVYDRHIHADLDDSLPTPRMWIGISH